MSRTCGIRSESRLQPERSSRWRAASPYPPPGRGTPFRTRAFTLIEVMIASGILFLCLFAILGLLANTLSNARALQRTKADAGIVAAFFSVTNRLDREMETGDFSDLGRFGDSYRDLEWTRAAEEVATNGLWLEMYTVRRRSTGQTESTLYRLIYDQSGQSGGLGIRGPLR